MKAMMVLCAAVSAAACAYGAGTLEVFVIDVEGGKAVLTVSPSGESLLMDAGWPGFGGRDASRIVDVAKRAGVRQIDYLVISHLDLDHVGDVPALVAAIPVRHIVDNGPLRTTGKGVEKRYETYAAARDRIDHIVAKPGDRVPIRGVDVRIVAAATHLIESPLPGGGRANPLCATTSPPSIIPEDLEDNMSIGLMFTLGRFHMLDLADLESAYQYKLVCPNNLLGPVDVYQVSVHGQAKGVTAVLAQALGARVAVMANGPRKGADPASWPILRAAPGLEDIWQLHFAVAGGKENNPAEDFIANPDADCAAKGLRISASSDGAFSVTNERNGFHKAYRPQTQAKVDRRKQNR
jgi:competence protein ComEC